jgi:ComF family protein
MGSVRLTLSYAAGALRVALGGLAAALLPPFCLECGAPLGAARRPLPLCPGCRGRLSPVAPRASCRLCARSLPATERATAVCLGCSAAPPPWSRLAAAWRYQPPLERVVRAFKFGGLDFLGGALAREGLAWAAIDHDGVDLVVPMPLAPLRRLARGFNQAERIARPLAERIGRPTLEALSRRGWHAPPQSGRPLARRRELGARDFRVRRPEAIAGRRILLVDDVLTTGSTARAAAAALRAAGARDVTVWVAAWTPPDRPGSALGGPARHPLDRG